MTWLLFIIISIFFSLNFDMFYIYSSIIKTSELLSFRHLSTISVYIHNKIERNIGNITLIKFKSTTVKIRVLILIL